MKAFQMPLLTLGAILLLLNQCSTGQVSLSVPPTTVASSPVPPPSDADLVIRAADIDDVQVVVGQGRKAQVTIKGLLHDGATQIHRIEQQTIAGGVNINITTARPKNSLARIALIPFERTVTVDLRDLPKGDCPLLVNNHTYVITVP